MSLYVNVHTTYSKILILSTSQQNAFVRSETQIETLRLSSIRPFIMEMQFVYGEI